MKNRKTVSDIIDLQNIKKTQLTIEKSNNKQKKSLLWYENRQETDKRQSILRPWH